MRSGRPPLQLRALGRQRVDLLPQGDDGGGEVETPPHLAEVAPYASELAFRVSRVLAQGPDVAPHVGEVVLESVSAENVA
jgi:hypothetical protein